MAAPASRYAQTQQQIAPQPTSTQSNSTSSTGSASSTESTGTTNSRTTNFDPTSQAALDKLIKELATGGTAGMRQDRAQVDQEVANVTQQRAGYSKEAAFADSQGLMAQQMRLALEKLLPGINSAALGSGASQSSMRALLTQKAGENAAQNAQAAGVNAAVAYGGVSNGMSQILAGLVSQADPATAALLNALATSKGGTVSTSGTTTGTQNTTQQQNTVGQDNKNIQYNSTGPGQSASSSLVQYGPSPDAPTTGSSVGQSGIPADILASLTSGSYEDQFTF